MNVKVISSEEIRHRAGECGVRIGRTEVIEVSGRRYVNNYWVQLETGRLHHIDTKEVV